MVEVVRGLKCAACDTPLSREGSSEGLCPSCLLALALDDTSAEADRGSTFTAQILNSGVFPTGSNSEWVNRLAAVSKKWKGMKTLPGMERSVTCAVISIEPRLEETRTTC